MEENLERKTDDEFSLTCQKQKGSVYAIVKDWEYKCSYNGKCSQKIEQREGLPYCGLRDGKW